ncbi:MAG: site-2 protease family protein [Candidatus Planktophila sp.]|jgi:membrane-associated protease RseP (regulator of RpoE activity)|nr:site-2 protease family protein [Candidatus Planktophila sp.]MBP7805610.1 site-2 protease family protein [Candidatus Planktophila sp.]
MRVIGVLAFVVALLFSVMIHEFGHYITAKKYGMRVSEFFLGFGKRLWSFTRGETEFGIKAIPAGGYCRIEGMTATDEMPIGEESRAFYKATSGRKLVVLGAGSFLHFVLGFIILLIIFAGIGVSKPTNTITDISACVPRVNAACADTDPKSPALLAGLKAGDVITSLNGVAVNNWAKDVEIIRESAGKELVIEIERNGQSQTISVVAATRVVDGKEYGFLGIVNGYELVRDAPFTSIKNSAIVSWDFISGAVKAIISLPSKIPALWGATISGTERDPNGLVGIVGVAQVTGQAASSDGLSTSERIQTFLLIIASLNFFVGVFNLLPILPLDGGHMAVAIADEVRAFIARIQGRARPEGINVNKLAPFTMVVFVLLAALTVLLLAADIINPIRVNF